MNVIKKKLNSLGLGKVSKFVSSVATACIRLQTIPTEENNIKIGESKIGGHPDLPDGFEWPKWNGSFISFLAQINLKDLHDFEKCEALPESGWLYFFYEFDVDTCGFEPTDKGAWKVIHFDSSLDKISRRSLPERTEKQYAYYDPCRVSFYKAVSVPGWDVVYNNVPGLNEEDRNKYEDFIDFLLESDPSQAKHQVFGFPLEVQGDMRCDCEIFSKGLDYDKVRKLSKREIEKIEENATEWALLFQIDSDDNAGMMWIDAGRLYFWIREEDFINRKFENTWMLLQCY